jgi:hypothetical protein
MTLSIDGHPGDVSRRITYLFGQFAGQTDCKCRQVAHSAYSIYAKATALRRDNLRRSAGELRAHLAKAEKALIEFGEAALDT